MRGDLYAIDEKTIRIENFRYDGTGVSKLLPSSCCQYRVSATVYDDRSCYKFLCLDYILTECRGIERRMFREIIVSFD